MSDSLWGEEFDSFMESIKKNNVQNILKKSKAPKVINKSAAEQLKSKNISLEDRLKLIEEHVLSFLGRHREDTKVIDNEKDLVSFIDKAIANGVLAYDTETDNSLDYLTCKIVGLCLYTPGCKSVYVPVYHVDYKTEELLQNLVSE